MVHSSRLILMGTGQMAYHERRNKKRRKKII
jgi:hypothetical protein